MGGLDPNEFDMLREIHANVSALGPQVEQTKEDIQYLRSNSKRIEIKVARLEEKHTNLHDDVNAIGTKVREHVGSPSLHRSSADAFTDSTVRWVWLAKVASAIVAIAALITMFAKFAAS